MTRSRWRSSVAVAAVVLGGIGVVQVASSGDVVNVSPPPVANSATQPLTVGVPTVVDPIRGAGEPIISVDNQNNVWVSGPAGTGTQTSWYFRSHDAGLTYTRLGPAAGHWVCNSTGGGDSMLTFDKVNGDMYVTDQQALASLATGKVDPNTGELTSKCFSTPSMTADRNFQAILHPTGETHAPQWKEGGEKPIIYMSWACQACGGGSPTGAVSGGLVFAWSDNGYDWHAADAGVPVDTLATDQFFQGGGMPGINWHGTMVVDQKTGYVYTGVSQGLEVGVAVGKPGQGRADPNNLGQFASMSYQKAADKLPDGKPWPNGSNLFPILAMDKAGTLYEAWVQGNGTGDTEAPLVDSDWHVYYTSSKDQPDHKVWSPPVRVDSGPLSATNVMTWMVAGDAGRLGFVWLGTDTREHPSRQNGAKQWHPFMAVVTGADTAKPAIQQTRVGIGPSHIGDICLQGTLCGATVPPGNRNMADFISIDVGPDGWLQATYANDANQVGAKVTDFVKGVPIDEVARQVSGPRVLAAPVPADARFNPTGITLGLGDAIGDALFNNTNVPQLDLAGASMGFDGTNLVAHIPVSDLGDLASPSGKQRNVWWLLTWKYHGKVYFAWATSVRGAPAVFAAGAPLSYDRPGLTYYTIPSLLDYSAGVPLATAKQAGNAFDFTIPPALVGNPKPGDVLESLTAWTVLDNGLPPLVIPGPTGNVPSVVDSTPAQNAVVSTASLGFQNAPVTSGAPVPSGPTVAPGAPGGPTRLPATGGDLPVAIPLALVLAAWALRPVRRRTA